MKKMLRPLAVALLFLPLAAQAGKKETVVVDINTSRGPAAITLVRKGDGFVGPRGEYYSTFPSKKTLTAVYGSLAPKPAPNSGSSAVSGEIKVVVVNGGVNIRRNDALFSKIRTKFPDVRGWKLQRENSQIVVKSGVDRDPGFVELFDVRTGQRLDKIWAKQIKGDRPAWAKNFAE